MYNKIGKNKDEPKLIKLDNNWGRKSKVYVHYFLKRIFSSQTFFNFTTIHIFLLNSERGGMHFVTLPEICLISPVKVLNLFLCILH